MDKIELSMNMIIDRLHENKEWSDKLVRRKGD